MQVKYFSCKEVAKMTGYSIYAVWQWCRTGKLKASRPGGRNYRIKPEDLEAFLASDNHEEPENHHEEVTS